MTNVTELYCVPVLGFVGASGTGKTTLLARLIPALRERGLRCTLIKHSHHDVEIDRPRKDSHRLRLVADGWAEYPIGLATMKNVMAVKGDKR